jgi:hypothetical protein
MMKFFSSVLLLAFFSVPAVADTKSEVRAVVREKGKLEREILTVFMKNGLGEDPEYVKLSEAAFAASKAFMETRRKAPELKEQYEASDAAQKKMIDAARKKDKEASKAAQGELIDARIALEKASKDLPGLKELQQKAIAANDLSGAKRLKLLATVPDGRALLDRIAAMDAKIQEVRESAE